MGVLQQCLVVAFAGLVATGVAPSTNAAARALLTRASSPAILTNACAQLVVALGASTAPGAAARRDAERDADAAAIVAFIHSRHDVASRVRCAEDFAALTNQRNLSLSLPHDVQEWHTAYGAAALDIIITLLHAPEIEMRVAAVKRLGGIQPRPVGRILLHVAQTDPDPQVRSTAFSSLPWPMRADIAATHDAATYRSSINAVLRSNDPAVVPGALIAIAALDELAADRTLRRYAFSPNYVIRAGAIDAYDDEMSIKPNVARFIESRLADPHPAVRAAVLGRLFLVGDHHAIPAILRLAASAPTAAERASASDYARLVKRQPDLVGTIRADRNGAINFPPRKRHAPMRRHRGA